MNPFPIEMRDAVSRHFPSPSKRMSVWIRKVDPKGGATKPSFFLEVRA